MRCGRIFSVLLILLIIFSVQCSIICNGSLLFGVQECPKQEYPSDNRSESTNTEPSEGSYGKTTATMTEQESANETGPPEEYDNNTAMVTDEQYNKVSISVIIIGCVVLFSILGIVAYKKEIFCIVFESISNVIFPTDTLNSTNNSCIEEHDQSEKMLNPSIA